MPPPVLLWFRDDLRLTDHAALHAAFATGQPVLPVYVLDEQKPWALGGAARWWLHHSLVALGRDISRLGGRLILRRGGSAAAIVALVREVKATAVFTGGMTDPAERAIDRGLAVSLGGIGVAVHRKRTATVYGPDQVKTKAGGPFGVYSPFARACLALPPPRDLWDAPKVWPAAEDADHPIGADPIDDWRLLPSRPDWAGELRATWTPGERGAMERLTGFLDEAVEHYAARRDRPGGDNTSMLSPHLRFGEISANQVFHAIAERKLSAGVEKFRNEMLWREFSRHLLWHNPQLPEAPLRPEFAAMPWRDDPAGLAAWQRGRTGVPIVDAGMRQLWRTGWMHNRVRMVVASFLVKHLLIDWRLGQAWFWDTLVDADLGNNAASWQWVAGCGADAAPYFRVFNPVLQGQKFDPEGVYARRFVPELSDVDTRHIHAPWEVGRTAPIVDLAEGRARALAAFSGLRREEAG